MSKPENERAIQNAKASMEMEGFAISDELIEFLRSEPSEEEIQRYIDKTLEKYKKNLGKNKNQKKGRVV